MDAVSISTPISIPKSDKCNKVNEHKGNRGAIALQEFDYSTSIPTSFAHFMS